MARALFIVFGLFSIHGQVLAGNATLSWDPDTAVAGYKLYYGTSSRNYGNTPVQVAKPTTSATVASLTAGQTYYFAVTGYDDSGAESGYSNEVKVVVPATPPPAPVADFSANPTTGPAALTVRFADASRDATAWTWSFGDGATSTLQNPTHTYAEGTYTVQLQVSGPGGNSAPATKAGYITVSASQTGGNPNASGLVAAYGFDEGAGATALDASGLGNHGAIQGASWSGTGRFGRSLYFNGSNSLISIGDNDSLDLTTGMTLEAWVYPTAAMSGTKNVISKETADGKAYWLRANNRTDQPEGGALLASGAQPIINTTQLPINQWSHLTVTYDGQWEALYINGQLVTEQNVTGNIVASTGALLIGGRVASGYFQGYLDEIRIYNRALSQSQIAADSNTAIGKPNSSLLIGNNAIEAGTDSEAQGVAEAFQAFSKKSGTIASLKIYLDSRTSATEVVAGIYDDHNGHPGTLLAQGALNAPKGGAWNSITIPATSLTLGRPYWIAILGSKGDAYFRSATTSSASPTESSAENNLTKLPNGWTTGAVWSTTTISAYGAGY